MKHLWNCRRSFIGLIGIICLTSLGYTKEIDVSVAIAAIVTSIAVSNAAQRVGEKKA